MIEDTAEVELLRAIIIVLQQRTMGAAPIPIDCPPMNTSLALYGQGEAARPLPQITKETYLMFHPLWCLLQI